MLVIDIPGNADGAHGNHFLLQAKVDIVGQCCEVHTRLTRDNASNGALAQLVAKMLLQKRHEKARITLHLESDHELPFNILVVIKTPGKPPINCYQTTSSKCFMSWQYSSFLHQTLATHDTIWEICTCAKTRRYLIFSIAFEACEDNAEQIAAEQCAKLHMTASEMDPICDFDTNDNDDNGTHAPDLRRAPTRAHKVQRTQLVMKKA